jgi:hypothetical protein
MTLSATTALLAATGSMLVAAPPKVAITGPGHTPVIRTHWDYSVTVTDAGKPVGATITEQIIDPIGGVHPVQFGTSTKNITNWPIKGSFHDFIIWPADSRGVPLTLRVTVHVGASKVVAAYDVTPKG